MTNVVVSSTQIFIEAGFQHWGLCIPRESENHVNVGPVSIWDVNEPVRTANCQREDTKRKITQYYDIDT